jgi:chemotaxis protein MotC
VLRALFRLRSLPGVDDKLLNGAFAFGEGRNKDALELLSSIDPRSLDPALGAQVALVMSTLIAPTDPKKAAALLDDARILAPGTLIEEAALRREIYVVATLENVEAFELLASQYMRRFPDSVYASSFREQFAEMTVRLDYGRDANWQARLAGLLSDTSRGQQVQFYLAIARRSVMQGKTALAGFSAGRAIELSDDGSADRERALVYRAAASIVGPDYERAVSDLERVSRTKLDKDDIELAEATLAVAAEVRRPSASLEPLPSAVPDPAKLGRERIAGTLKSAQSTIARVDDMLSEGRR